MTENVWVIDDDQSIRWVLDRALSKAGIPISAFNTADQAMHHLHIENPLAILTDIRMQGMSGLDFLEEVKESHPNVPIIVMTAHSDLDSTVSSFEKGAFEYLAKPFDVDEVVAVVRRAIVHASENQERQLVSSEPTPEIIGKAPAMQEVFRAIGRLSSSNVSVLITGPSGSGKELVANSIHRHSPRGDAPFIALNVAAIPDDLVESELFGHEKGAFTGAVERKDGKFLAANSGSIFLDEIGDMSPSLQAKILRVLESGEIERVGGAETIRVDVRIISATNQDLEKRISDGSFRQDLFHRINVFPITVPPLRDRKEDILPTTMSILKSLKKKHKISVNCLSHDAMQTLCQYDWPGNVRELENTLERVVLIHDKPIIETDDIKYILDENSSSARAQRVEDVPAKETEVAVSPTEKNEVVAQTEQQGTVAINTTEVKTLKELEYEAIVAGLARNNWNMTTTSQELGISRMTLYRKLDQHGLRKEDG